MGLYITLGDKIYNMKIDQAIDFQIFGNFSKIHEELEKREKLLIFITKSTHKIKKKAEQMACDNAIKLLNN